MQTAFDDAQLAALMLWLAKLQGVQENPRDDPLETQVFDLIRQTRRNIAKREPWR